MALYNTGSVNVTIGSSEIIGNGTSFLSNVAAGYYFKLRESATWYEVATINSATKLQLSARYTDTNYQTSRTAEQLASIVAGDTTYSGVVSYTPVMQSHFSLNASIETFTDDGGGVLTGDGSPAGSGTIDYDSGSYAITLGTNITATANLVASYISGDTRTAMPYQILTDYTSYYNIPEMSLGDINFQYIFTKAMRLIDSLIYSASMVPQFNITTTGTLTSTQCRGGVGYVSASSIIGLPAVSILPEGSYVTIYCTTASPVSIDPNSVDRIRLDGVALADGTMITSSESVGDYISLHRDSTSGWTTLGRQGTWVSA